MEDDIKVIDTVLLLALPASGKSELRRYLEHLDGAESRERYHLGPSVQLDDYPYVHLMRRIDDELAGLGAARIFFEAPDRGFADGRDWGTLIELVNEDHARLLDLAAPETGGDPVGWLCGRVDRARELVGAPAALAALGRGIREALAGRLAADCATIATDLARGVPESLERRTVVIEFARGGPAGAALPLAGQHGYAYSLSRLSAAILERASILYVWVTPEQSRRKNRERTRPDADGSILFHGVPEHVMRNDYGCDDMEFLLAGSDIRETVRVESRGRIFHLPAARFDNREDLTTFLRAEPGSWGGTDLERLRIGLGGAFESIRRSERARR
ncbi:MAG TPA: hypothetical protein VM285_05895 [Polyangia bacterium]|nr:hypothetical protein [Polyangia bacterium]